MAPIRTGRGFTQRYPRLWRRGAVRVQMACRWCGDLPPRCSKTGPPRPSPTMGVGGSCSAACRSHV